MGGRPPHYDSLRFSVRSHFFCAAQLPRECPNLIARSSEL